VHIIVLGYCIAENIAGGKHVSSNFLVQLIYVRKDAFRVRRLKFSADKFQNSRCNIRNLYLLKKDANLSRPVLRNLYESINRKFYAMFIIIRVKHFFVNEMYFSFVIGNNSTCPSYAIAVFYDKWASYRDKLWKTMGMQCNSL